MKMTPLINRNLFFDNPAIAGGKISPNGNYISFLKEYNGIMNIWIKRFDEEFDNAVPLTASPSPILGYFWSYDANHLLYINDNNGDENYNIFKLVINTTLETLPTSTNLTPLKEVTAQIFLASKLNPEILMIGLNDRDKAWHDLYQLNVNTGKLTLIEENHNRLGGWEFDWNENIRLAYRTDENGFQQILRKNSDNTYKKIFETNLKESAQIAGWTKDNEQCYLVTNKGEINLMSLYLFNPKSETLTFVEADPLNQSDLQDAYIDSYAKELVFTRYNYDKPSRVWQNESIKKDFSVLDTKFEGQEWQLVSRTNDFNKCLIGVSGDTKVAEMYYFDRTEGTVIFQYTTRPQLQELESYLSPMTFITYESSDGLKIPAYLTRPKNGIKPYPMVTLVHGGPKGPRDNWGYNGAVQFLANRGYAVLQPNFRASGGFGKHYLNAGDKEWGKKMQDDITYGVQHLIESGLVDKDRIAIMGGSYGGYATLAGLAFTPDVYACGVDIVGPSNLFTLLESIPPYWEAGRKWLYEMVGDPDTEEGQKLLKDASPLFSAEKISKPLMIIQGANDPRVKQAESDQIVEALKKNGKPYMYLCAEDEGHGFRKPLNNLAMYAAIEKFLSTHLGGRMQEEIEKEVFQTLQNITVGD